MSVHASTVSGRFRHRFNEAAGVDRWPGRSAPVPRARFVLVAVNAVKAMAEPAGARWIMKDDTHRDRGARCTQHVERARAHGPMAEAASMAEATSAPRREAPARRSPARRCDRPPRARGRRRGDRRRSGASAATPSAGAVAIGPAGKSGRRTVKVAPFPSPGLAARSGRRAGPGAARSRVPARDLRAGA